MPVLEIHRLRIMATTEVQVASLRARVDEYSSRYAQALAAMKATV